jgi:hypothetical protein
VALAQLSVQDLNSEHLASKPVLSTTLLSSFHSQNETEQLCLFCMLLFMGDTGPVFFLILNFDGP